jgi:hypothetical protein
MKNMKKRLLKIGLPILAVLLTIAVLSQTVFSNPVKVYASNQIISIGNTIETSQPLNDDRTNIYDADGNLAKIDGFDTKSTKIVDNKDGTFTYTEKWIVSYETLLFSTPDGDLDVGNYALDGTGTGYYIRTIPTTQGQFIHIDLALKDDNGKVYSLKGLTLVSIVAGHGYYDEFLTSQGAKDDWTVSSQYYGADFSTLPAGDVVRRQSSAVAYNPLKTVANASQPVRTEKLTSSAVPQEPIGLPNGDGIGYDATSNSGKVGDVSSYAWNHTCGATANLLVFGDSHVSTTDRTVAVVTYNAAALTLVRSDINAAYRTTIYYMVAPTTGSAKTVSVTYSGTLSHFGVGGVVSYSGAKQTGQPDAHNGANSATGNPSVSVTTVADNSWVFSVVSARYSSTCDNTQRWNVPLSGADFPCGGSDTNAPKTPAGAQTMSWAQSTSSYWAISAASFAPAVSNTYNLTNSPSSIDFGVIQPSTKYYAYGSAPSNPVTDGQCTFTITNSQSNAIKVNIQATNFTGGGGWTLGAPDGTHARLIAYYSGQNPASGVTLTTSPQAFVASLAGSATIKWDFSFEDATSFADGVQKSSTITITGLAP